MHDFFDARFAQKRDERAILRDCYNRRETLVVERRAKPKQAATRAVNIGTVGYIQNAQRWFAHEQRYMSAVADGNQINRQRNILLSYMQERFRGDCAKCQWALPRERSDALYRVPAYRSNSQTVGGNNVPLPSVSDDVAKSKLA